MAGRILMWALLAASGWSAAEPPGDAHADHALGRVVFPVSCSGPARSEFERAAALLHHMTYPQARAAFEGLARREPDCAMAHWGVAMTLFQPLWPTRPGPAELARGRAAVAAARAAQAPTERERLFIAGAAAFFDDTGAPDYWTRIRRWQQAMQALHDAFPDDPEATAFHALALLAVAPADQALARTQADRAAGLLLPLYRANPEHPGAMHYLVHANDVPGRERELLAIVRKYETVAPRNPHALHMPTHIYTRLGDWPAVIRGNLRAAEAALDHRAGARGEYVWDEFPHAIEYLVYASLQQGDDAAAAAQLARLQGTANLEPSFKTAFHLSSIPARYALERRDWAAAAALPPRTPRELAWDRFPWPEAVTWFARGLGAARTGRPDAAQAAVARLRELEASAGAAGEDLFARSIRVLALATEAWLAQSRGDAAAARRLMAEAAALEAATPKHAVTPAPTLPASELLGDLLSAQQRPREAVAAYERANEAYPRRFNTLLGLARAAHAAGDDGTARSAYRELLEVAGTGTRADALVEARAFVDKAAEPTPPR